MQRPPNVDRRGFLLAGVSSMLLRSSLERAPAWFRKASVWLLAVLPTPSAIRWKLLSTLNGWFPECCHVDLCNWAEHGKMISPTWGAGLDLRDIIASPCPELPTLQPGRRCWCWKLGKSSCD